MKKPIIIFLAVFLLFAFALPALAVTNFTAQRNPDGSITLSWSDGKQGETVKIRRHETSTLWQTIATVQQTDGTYIDRTAQPDKTYIYMLVYGPFDVNSTGEVTVPPYQQQQQGGNQGGQSNQNGQNGPRWQLPSNGIYDQGHLPVINFWYYTLTALSGVFMFIVIVKTGYQYIRAGVSPGARADFIETIQMCVVALAIIMLAPTFVKVLIDINNGMVALFAKMTTAITLPDVPSAPVEGMFTKILAAPFQVINWIFEKIFGLYPLDELIFNHKSVGLGGLQSMLGNVNTFNPFTQVLLNLVLVGFNFYFNAIYTLRRWTVIATWVATPIIVWIWAFTKNRQVMELWLAEIVSTVFMQTFHAMSFGIFLSVVSGNQNPASVIGDVGKLAEGFKNIGLWVAGFGGAVAAYAMVVIGFRLMLARDERTRAEAKEGVSKVIIGLLILGLSLMIAGFLAALMKQNWLLM
ncbi:MAG: pilin [Bacillota bacterium]